MKFANILMNMKISRGECTTMPFYRIIPLIFMDSIRIEFAVVLSACNSEFPNYHFAVIMLI